MLPILLFALLAKGPPAAVPVPGSSLPGGDPPVRLRLSDDAFMTGEKARVRVKARDDGHLLILRIDGEGRIRVLSPVDPDDSTWIRGGREYEVRGRGDRDAFVVDERGGSGLVLAAWSRDPFDFSAYQRGRHWDLRRLGDSASADDPELALLDLVESMATGPYEYDLARYRVLETRLPSHARYYRPLYHDPWFVPGWAWYRPRFRVGVGIVIGSPWHHGLWW